MAKRQIQKLYLTRSDAYNNQPFRVHVTRDDARHDASIWSLGPVVELELTPAQRKLIESKYLNQ